MTCPGRIAELDRLFAGDLEGPAALDLREHVDGCPACRVYYDRLSRVASTVEGRAVPSFAAATLEKRLMARVGVADRSLPAAPAPLPLPLPLPRRTWGPVLGLAAAAALAALFIPWAVSHREEEGGFTARSGGSARTAYLLRAFCIRGEAVSTEASPGNRLWCPAGGAVQLTLTSPEPVSVRVQVRTSSGDTLEPGGAIQVPAGTDIPLPVSIPSSESWLREPAVMTVSIQGRSGQGVEHQLTIAP